MPEGAIPDAKILADRLALAVEAAMEAGRIALLHVRRAGLEVQTKGDGSPVTAADREGERAVRAAVERAFPDDALLGEEWGEREGRSGFRWIIDPIDGTASFVAGVPLWGTVVGVDWTGAGGEARAVIGVIHLAALGESVWAARGGGCVHRRADGEVVPARVSSQASLERARFGSPGLEYFRTEGRRRLFLELCGAFGSQRGWGDCFGHLLVATGRLDCVIDPVLSPWDITGVVPIVEEAGGRWTDWQGRADHFAPTGVSSNGLIHERVVSMLRGR
jgi:histidinol phosphatase-like enzyme (inositol monophosphatase family)